MLLTYEFDMYKRFLVQICNHKYHNLISLYEWNDGKRASVEQTCATLSARRLTDERHLKIIENIHRQNAQPKAMVMA